MVAAALAATSFVAAGVPVLRHDWPPIETNVSSALDSVTGWNPIGLGIPDAYPSSFLIVPLRAIVAAVFGPYLAHIAFFFGTYLLTSFGAARIGRVLGAQASVRIAMAIFALFNSWVYTQVVAGHIFMLLAYGATIWIVAELLSERSRETTLGFLALAVAPQIQFLAIDTLAYIYIAYRDRTFRPALVLGAMWFPVLVSIAATHNSLSAIPFTLSWEAQQSIPLPAAWNLTGYFTHYDASIEPAAGIAIAIFVCVGSVGIVIAFIRRRTSLALVSLAFQALPVLIATGSKGPIAPIFAWLVRHVSAVALFRELYDLLAFAAIGYLCAVALVGFALRGVSVVVAIAAIALPIAWTFSPPGRYFVYAESIPPAEIRQGTHARFVVLPALYPVTSLLGGSGIDPDLRPRAGDTTPLNEYFATYPFSSALGQYLADGSTRGFALLGAERLYERKWLSTARVVGGQFALPLPILRARHVSSIADGPVTPMLGLSPLPSVVSAGTAFEAGNVLFSDARSVIGPSVPERWKAFADTSTVAYNNSFVQARSGWVDARLAFVERPQIGNAYGGAITTNSDARLPIVGGLDALVFVRGTLKDERGSPLAASTDGYRWIKMPTSSHFAICTGECVVAVQGLVPSGIPLEAPRKPVKALDAYFLTPWFVRAILPPGHLETLRLNASYDPLWIAWANREQLAHLRIDGTTNGWLIAASHSPRKIVMMEVGALCTAVSEVIATALCIVVFFTLRFPRSLRLLRRSP